MYLRSTGSQSNELAIYIAGGSVCLKVCLALPWLSATWKNGRARGPATAVSKKCAIYTNVFNSVHCAI